MLKRNFYSLVLISLIAVLLVSSAFADSVTFESKAIPRCVNQTATVTATVTTANVSAIEVIVEISGDYTLPAAGARFTWDPAFTALGTHVVDDTSCVHGTGPDTLRIAAMMVQPSDAPLAAGTYVIGRINYHSIDLCAGSIALKPVVFTYPIPAPVATSFVDAATSAILPVGITNGAITFNDQAPVMDTLNTLVNATLFWGATYSHAAISFADPDLANGCEALAFSKQVGPATMTVNTATGAISWATTSTDIGDHPVTIRLTDKCGTFVEKSFNICVQNKPPTITKCYKNVEIALGGTITDSIFVTDPDGGPGALVYTLLGITGPTTPPAFAGAPAVNPITGVFTWATVDSIQYLGGPWTATVVVTDNAPLSTCSPSNADTCVFTFNVVYGNLKVQKFEQSDSTGYQGQFNDVEVYLHINYHLGGFDLLLAYDNSALSLQNVLPGNFITDCQWEYFTYRFGTNGNCTGACPTGLVKVVGLAETNNGNHHPLCFTNYPAQSGDSVLFTLHFLTSNNRTYACQYVPIEWYWTDCTDNALSNTRGDTLLISRNVYSYSGNVANPYDLISKLGESFPTKLGAQDTCDTHNKPGKPDTWRIVDFYNGGIDFICNESIDARGDINLNSINNEIADVVMFTNYFIQGLSAFGPDLQHQQGSIAASDVNADGTTLQVADLVYLIRVVVGDALPFPKVSTREASSVKVSVTNESGRLSTSGSTLMGGAFIVVAGNVTPELLATNMDMTYRFDGLNTRILVSPKTEKALFSGFTGTFIDVKGTVVTLDMATLTGEPVASIQVPKNFSLSQNYPNPFNPTTKINFALPTAGNYTLTIYNVQGQVVKTFEGTSEAGFLSVDWNASNNASGVYFYKLTAGKYTDTKKMVLLK